MRQLVRTEGSDRVSRVKCTKCHWSRRQSNLEAALEHSAKLDAVRDELKERLNQAHEHGLMVTPLK